MRPARVLALAALLLLAASALPCVAQTPSGSPSVTVAIDGEAGTVSVETAAEFDVAVTNTGTPTGTPLDEQNTGDVTVTVTGIPDGWTASVEPAAFRLGPGQSQKVTLRVSVSADAPDGQADLTVTAVLKSALERLDPILGNIPGGTQLASAEDSITVTRDDSVTRDVLEAIGPWIYAVLLLMVAAVLVAVAISVSSRRTLVRLSSDSRELTVAPGGRVAFPFRMEGLAKQTDTVLLQVSAVQEGWAAFLPVPELTLEPGQAEEMSLVVIAPKDAPQGAKQAILVTATSAKAPKGAANLEFVALVEGLIPLEAGTAPKRRKSE